MQHLKQMVRSTRNPLVEVLIVWKSECVVS